MRANSASRASKTRFGYSKLLFSPVKVLMKILHEFFMVCILPFKPLGVYKVSERGIPHGDEDRWRGFGAQPSAHVSCRSSAWEYGTDCSGGGEDSTGCEPTDVAARKDHWPEALLPKPQWRETN